MPSVGRSVSVAFQGHGVTELEDYGVLGMSEFALQFNDGALDATVGDLLEADACCTDAILVGVPVDGIGHSFGHDPSGPGRGAHKVALGHRHTSVHRVAGPSVRGLSRPTEDPEASTDASTKQFLMIDQRRMQQFMIDRSTSMVELGYTKQPIDESAFDWSMLEEVIAEEPELYRSLIVV